MAPVAGPFLPRRRSVLAAGAFLPVAWALPTAAAGPGRSRVVAVAPYRFLTAHQGAVLVEATARLVPGPLDDRTETGHPGAREAGVTHFIDRLLSALEDDRPPLFTGGPWSNRHASGPDHMAVYVPLVERQRHGWKTRIAQLRHEVAAAVVTLDAAAKAAGYADFVAAPPTEQDRILAAESDARNTLFALTIDGMYSVPEYGGNANLSAWHEIRWPGDVQPVGYSPAEVERDEGPDPVAADDLPVVEELIHALPVLARGRRRLRSIQHG